MTKYLLVLGASSDIAKAVVYEYAKEGYDLYLAGRNMEELKKDASDILIQFNIQAIPLYFDVLDYNSHQRFYNSLIPSPEGVICAIGYLGNQEKSQTDFIETKKIIDTNFTGCVSILNITANDFALKKQGFIIGISSVAGDRGRGSNYTYGSSKAALTAYLSGLRCRLAKSNVHVLTVIPGFVATKMTEDLNLPKGFTARPKEVAKDIIKAQILKKDVIYTKWFWQIIMFVIKTIPEKLYKNLKL